MFEIKLPSGENKKELYESLCAQVASLIEDETNMIANLANVSACLNEFLTEINWVGFYLMEKDTLVLGPFQGKVACIRISMGKGVCGSAACEGVIKRIGNVHKFEGHIACDSASNSEIVIPIKVGEQVVGVLDIDSPKFERFDDLDEEYLAKCVRLLEKGCDWSAYLNV
ncbi:MAG: GAF domain-containing protein [Cellulosilyticaceae bacterium]